MCMIWWTDCLQTGLKKCNLWFWKECSFLCWTIVSDTLKPTFCPNMGARCCRLCSSCCHLLSSGVNVKHTNLFSPPLLFPFPPTPSLTWQYDYKSNLSSLCHLPTIFPDLVLTFYFLSSSLQASLHTSCSVLSLLYDTHTHSLFSITFGDIK